jgi:hypothetical protein
MGRVVLCFAGGPTCTATEFANAVASNGYSAQPDSKRSTMLASIQRVSVSLHMTHTRATFWCQTGRLHSQSPEATSRKYPLHPSAHARCRRCRGGTGSGRCCLVFHTADE